MIPCYDTFRRMSGVGHPAGRSTKDLHPVVQVEVLAAGSSHVRVTES